MKVSFIIPVYNEELTIEKVVESVLDLPFNKDVIAVNDGSTDNTPKILSKFKNKIKIINVDKNIGKGGALIEGLKFAEGDVIAFLDADLEIYSTEYINLIESILKNEAEVVLGSRFLNESQNKVPFYQLYGNKMITLFANLFFGTKITDVETAAMIFKKDVIKNIHLISRGWDISIEIIAKISKKKVKIKELPIKYFPRNKEQGKKINWKAGLAAFYHILKYKLIN